MSIDPDITSDELMVELARRSDWLIVLRPDLKDECAVNIEYFGMCRHDGFVELAKAVYRLAAHGK